MLKKRSLSIMIALGVGAVLCVAALAFAAGMPEEIRTDPRVIEAYLGRISATA